MRQQSAKEYIRTLKAEKLESDAMNHSNKLCHPAHDDEQQQHAAAAASTTAV